MMPKYLVLVFLYVNIKSLTAWHCKKPNEHYECGPCGACETKCATLGEKCVKIYNKYSGGCYCDEGYARNAKGLCVPINQCRALDCPRKNEEYCCGSACQTRCDNYNKTCPIINIECNDACYCKEGFARDGSDTAKCIPIAQCPVPLDCPRPNEEYACGSACQTRCDNYNETCPIVNIRCKDACYCKEGFARDGSDTAECIPIAQCSGPHDCPRPNEEYACGSECQTRCDNYNKTCPVINTTCKDACYCKEGFARDGSDTDECIPIAQCPEPLDCPRPNEEYACGSACQTRCDNYNETCSIINIRCTDACYCKEGFARDGSDIDECVPIAQCPAPHDCPRPNEEYACGSECQTRCDNYNKTCPIINNICKDACYCKEGFARDGSDTDECIPIAQCPAPLDCPRPNEEYSCGSACQTRCDNYNKTCPIINIRCNDACYCKEGFARDGSDTAACIPIAQCPAPLDCPRPNEEYACGSACQTRCDNYNKTCPIINNKCKDACYCKEGFARDGSDTAKCIPITQCPAPLKCPRPNEKYACGSACQTRCDNYNKTCPIINTRCTDACYCIVGFARNGSNIAECIPITKCPGKHCKGPHEELLSYGSPCQTECSTLGTKCRGAQNTCHPECHCIRGYARNSKGVCVHIRKCRRLNQRHAEIDIY